MCWLCSFVWIPYWPFRSRRQCKVVVAAAIALILFGSVAFRSYNEVPHTEWDELSVNGSETESTTEEFIGNVEDYEAEDREIKLFDELDPNEITLNNDIFFFVASGAVDLLPREACVVESAAELHRGKKVFVIFIQPNITEITESDTLLTLLGYDNIVYRHIRPSKYLVHPALNDWFVNSDFQNSDHLAAFLNSALSYAFLNKFGGTATSFDIFLRRPLGPSGQFISRCENEDLVEQFPMTAEAGGILTQDLVEQLRHAYDAANPDSTGSKLITRRLSRLCKVKYIQELEYKDCKWWPGKLLPPRAFCPVEEGKHWMIFDPVRSKLVRRKIEEDDSLGLRLWLRHSEDIDNWGGPGHETAFYRLGEQHCPLIMQILSDETHF